MRNTLLSYLQTAIACLICCCTTATYAQDDRDRDPVNTNGLIIEATAGWDGVVDRLEPIPISLLLTNNTESIIEGQLFLTNPIGGNEVYLGEMTLAPKSTRRFGTIRNLEDWFECFAELRVGSRVLFRNELPISTGSDFKSNENFVLLIDDSGRRLITQKKQSTTEIVNAANSQGRSPTAGKGGRDIRSLNAKSWQIPTHPAPLVPVQAIVFPEATPASNLNKTQWRCLAEWVCEGGTLFFHSESKDVLTAITSESPLTFTLADTKATAPVRSMGLGEIREFADPLFSSKGAEARQRIANRIRNLDGPVIREFLKNTYVEPADYQTEVQLNRLYVAGLFGIYTLFIGLFAILLFRFSKRTMMLYTVFVVLGGCVAAGVLGGILRVSQGDLKVASVTQIGAGGVIQVARFDVQSSGGRNEDVAVSGNTPNLQFTGQSSEGRYYWNNWNQQKANPPFDQQLNRFGADTRDSFQVKVLMTPWGRRQLHATDFKQNVEGFDVKLEFAPSPKNMQQDSPAGMFKLTVKNPGSIQVQSAWLFLGVTRYKEYEESDGNIINFDPWGRPTYETDSPLVADQMVDMYQSMGIDRLNRKTSVVQEFGARMRESRTDYGRSDLEQSFGNGRFTFPKLNRAGTVQAWLIASVAQSPIMNVDQENTQFIEQNAMHILIQEIPTANLPDPAVFLGPKPPPPPPEEDEDTNQQDAE
ncbi:MAG: hypothetical protein AB8G99_16580 [Planctomycetaceae bacterium]